MIDIKRCASRRRFWWCKVTLFLGDNLEKSLKIKKKDVERVISQKKC